MKKTITLIVLLLAICSCKDSEMEQKLLVTQQKLVETEQKLLETTNVNLANADLVKIYEEVEKTIVHSTSDKYTIRIDRTHQGRLRYLSWMHPKTPFEKPDVVVYDGEIEETSTWGVSLYKFSSNGFSYIVETVPIKRNSNAKHIFLEILESNTQKFYGKMKNLSRSENL
ncbi:hypothetical protein [Flagellimonas myxillae]|uniref:hypothetical protein n=1 Tax=Flagellimonas myxillae TaxID=2942214 RepID=UPI00201FAC29|nr:hypothetical protein [Muricauda myxillae]MCL6265901.1 hypothetical protein [Muricauda myxillae]